MAENLDNIIQRQKEAIAQIEKEINAIINIDLNNEHDILKQRIDKYRISTPSLGRGINTNGQTRVA